MTIFILLRSRCKIQGDKRVEGDIKESGLQSKMLHPNEHIECALVVFEFIWVEPDKLSEDIFLALRMATISI